MQKYMPEFISFRSIRWYKKIKVWSKGAKVTIQRHYFGKMSVFVRMAQKSFSNPVLPYWWNVEEITWGNFTLNKVLKKVKLFLLVVCSYQVYQGK